MQVRMLGSSNTNARAAVVPCFTPAAAAARPWRRTTLLPPAALLPPPSSSPLRMRMRMCMPRMGTIRIAAQPPSSLEGGDLAAAAEAGNGEDDGTTTSSSSSSSSSSSVLAPGMVAPAVRLQQRLSPKERSLKRAEAEQRAREGTLVQVNVGAAGVTPAVLRSAMDVLGKRGFVRMRCGVGGAERKQLARDLSALLDAETVHAIGHTITLYRAVGLPRPVGCSCSSAEPIEQ